MKKYRQMLNKIEAKYKNLKNKNAAGDKPKENGFFNESENILLEEMIAKGLINYESFEKFGDRYILNENKYPISAIGLEIINKNSYLRFRNCLAMMIIRDVFLALATALSIILFIKNILK